MLACILMLVKEMDCARDGVQVHSGFICAGRRVPLTSVEWKMATLQNNFYKEAPIDDLPYFSCHWESWHGQVAFSNDLRIAFRDSSLRDMSRNHGSQGKCSQDGSFAESSVSCLLSLKREMLGCPAKKGMGRFWCNPLWAWWCLRTSQREHDEQYFAES